jgi:hypothetical protein
MEVSMSPIPSIGLAELVILTGVTGLACCVPLVGLVALVVVMVKRRKESPPVT